jgi:hypothetical protein
MLKIFKTSIMQSLNIFRTREGIYLEITNFELILNIGKIFKPGGGHSSAPLDRAPAPFRPWPLWVAITHYFLAALIPVHMH